jgi:hypothetical protein
MPLREAVSVGVDAAGLVGEMELFSLACGLVASQRVATIDTIANEGIPQQVAEGGVEASPHFCRGIKEQLERFRLYDVRAKPIAEAIDWSRVGTARMGYCQR